MHTIEQNIVVIAPTRSRAIFHERDALYARESTNPVQQNLIEGIYLWGGLGALRGDSECQ